MKVPAMLYKIDNRMGANQWRPNEIFKIWAKREH